MTTDNDRDELIRDGDEPTIKNGDALPGGDSPQVQDKYKTLKEQTEPFRFKPNQSGNPGGRPAGKSITAELRKLLDKGTTAEELARALLDMSKTKHTREQLPALKELLDRTDGKVVETHRLEADMPVNITLKLVKGKDDGD